MVSAGVLLLEGTVVQLKNRALLQFFRSNAGYIFSAQSNDRGRSWSVAQPIPSLLNPSSKVSLEVVSSNGLLAVAYNDHGKLIDGQKVRRGAHPRAMVHPATGLLRRGWLALGFSRRSHAYVLTHAQLD
eukprot:2432937-Pyramimonas_sp.AAC.1